MVKKDGSIVRRCSLNGVEYRVISTERGRSASVWDAVDTIRNEKKMSDKVATRKKWKQIFDGKNWKEIKDIIILD